ncbi:MAG TPA: NAD-dependent epimerase/dehydratase family protein [Anaerolineae bacterium]|nr:NAD-dependent epimerase/dehydratase family protein [Anaerolineae bacterium]
MTDLAAELSGKRTLITGGLGFIGSNLARRLVELGAEVLLVDSLIPDYGGNLFNIAGIEDRVRVNIADVRDEYGMNYLVQGQDVIFNLAGQVSHLDSMRDPYTDLEINCRSQLSILEACRKHNPGVKIVYAGTRQIYGRPQYLPVDETHPLEPTDINGVNKLAGEWYHIIYHRAHGLRTVSLRMTNIYGPCMRVKDARQTFIGWWLHQIVDDEELQIFGDGRQVRDFNYVDDVVEALVLAAADPTAEGQIYNLGGDDPINLLDLAELLIRVNGGGSYRIVPFPADRKRIDIGDYHGDYSRIRAHLGWRPTVPLRDGLERAIAFYRQYREHYW